MVTTKCLFRGMLLFALVPLVLLCSTAQAQTTLRWKFKEGDKFNYVTEQSTTSVGNIMGMEIETKMGQTMDMTWVVKSVASDGGAELAQTIDRIRMKMETPFGAFDYDSKENKPIEGQFGEIMGPILTAIAGAEMTVKMAPTGEVSDVKIPEKVMESLRGNPLLAQFGPMFSEDGLKQMAQGGA